MLRQQQGWGGGVGGGVGGGGTERANADASSALEELFHLLGRSPRWLREMSDLDLQRLNRVLEPQDLHLVRMGEVETLGIGENVGYLLVPWVALMACGCSFFLLFVSLIWHCRAQQIPRGKRKKPSVAALIVAQILDAVFGLVFGLLLFGSLLFRPFLFGSFSSDISGWCQLMLCISMPLQVGLWRARQTLGQALLGVRVVDRHSARPPHLCVFLLMMGLDWLCSPFNLLAHILGGDSIGSLLFQTCQVNSSIHDQAYSSEEEEEEEDGEAEEERQGPSLGPWFAERVTWQQYEAEKHQGLSPLQLEHIRSLATK